MLVNSNIDRPHNAVIDWTNQNILQAQITWSSNWLPFQCLSVFLYGSCFSNFSLRSVFCHYLFILLPFNFWPLHYLSLQLLSTHLVFSSVFHKDRDITLKGQMTEKTLKGKFANILTGQSYRNMERANSKNIERTNYKKHWIDKWWQDK